MLLLNALEEKHTLLDLLDKNTDLHIIVVLLEDTQAGQDRICRHSED